MNTGEYLNVHLINGKVHDKTPRNTSRSKQEPPVNYEKQGTIH